MKYLLCAVFATLYVAASADNIMDRPSHVLEHRERTGHFNEYPYADLYKNYVQVFIAPQFKGTDVHETDSYRNYAASAEHCFGVFDLLIDNEYRVEKLEKLVELDSCLGYLYDEAYVERYHAQDKSRPLVAEKLDRYINDPKLKAFYDGTQIDKLELKAKVCVGELLLKTIQIKHQFTDLACNNHHIQLLNNFGDCHKRIPQDIVPNDTYLSVLYQLIKTKGEECFQHELLATNDAVRDNYKNNLWRKVKGWTPQGKQLQKRMWPAEMRRLLAAVQAASKDDLINLREILAFARATYKRVEEPQNHRYVSTLLNNMALYASKNIDMNKVSTSLGVQDEDGRIRYKNLVDDLCFYFRSTDYEGNYDYATAFARLVHMLDYPELYGMTQKKFIKTILDSGETAPTYTSIMMCNIITYTQGSIVRTTTKRQPHYRVTFKADTTGMIRWPDAGFF